MGVYLVFLTVYLLSGWNVLNKAAKNILHGKIFDENFLMTIATVGAIIIGELPEAAGVMIFYSIGEYLQSLAVNKSRNTIKALLEIRPDYANLKTGDGIKKVNPSEVMTGDYIVIRAGEKIPLDGEITEGSSYLNTFALTGEHIPRFVEAGDTILAGMVNSSGVNRDSGLITVKVTSDYNNSAISRILEQVENASARKSKTERFITTFSRYYTPVVVLVAVFIALLPPLLVTGQTFGDWVYRALVLLVISCPCALVISIPLGYFGGIGRASARGIMVKGSGYLDSLTKVRTVVFDKTGTLTKGVFKVVQVAGLNGYSEKDVLFYAASAEVHSNHPAAKSILEYYKTVFPESVLPEPESMREIPGQGIKAVIGGNAIITGNDKLLQNEKLSLSNTETAGTVVHVAVNFKYAGYIVISDEIKENSSKVVKQLSEMGIDTVMLTGDNNTSAETVSARLGIKKFYSGLLPHEKVECFEKIMSENREGKTVFVGDGINDAPVITRADVGFAMGGLGSDAAIEAADVVIMEDDPLKVDEAINIAKETRTVIWQNIILAMSVKAFFISLGAAGEATMWEAVFADMGVALLAILNAARLLRR